MATKNAKLWVVRGVSTLPRDWNYSTNCVIAATAAAANGPVAYYHIFER